MWGRDVGGAPGGLRLLLLLLLPGSMGLECLSCGSDTGGCDGAEMVSCPPESDVCVEALGAVVWSHGRFWLGGRGCGRGQPGGHARALQLAGLVLFSRRRHCRGGRGCNRDLPLGQQEALPAAGGTGPAPPTGLRCFGCPDTGACRPPRVLRCPGELRACFRGNVTLTLGGRRLWREVRGCAREANCSAEPRGDGDAALSGSCCTGDLCNGPGPDDGDDGTNNGTDGLFAPDLPRLQLLPHGRAPAGGDGTGKMAAGRGNMAAGGGGVNGGVNGVNGSTNGVNGGVNGVNGDVNGVNGSVNGVNGVNGDVNGVNGDVNGVNGSANGFNGSANGDVKGVNGDAVGVNGSTNGANSDITGASGDVTGVNGDITGASGDVTGVNSDVTGVNGSTSGVGGDVTGGRAGTNMAAGANGSVGGGDGDASGKMAAGRAGRPPEGQGGTEGPVGRGHPGGGASWLLPLLLLPLL
ncbi:uncharacterized PE-PGRS family protein PE_PGRS54-like isoform X2 [Caloenas nicobarica]|uniref:uncharacterized PE-PGRS family protein PE_PGRS54-like isoform X2 n=1 Tax=Caloenas nicobarica TaxID=187106 RepID=UPI0032B83386